MILRPSALLDYEDCPRKYWYSRVLKAKPRITPAALVFGSVMHDTLRTLVEASVAGSDARLEPAHEFSIRWQTATETDAIDYPRPWTAETLAATGRALAEQFLPVWQSLDLLPLVNAQGHLLVEQRLCVPLDPDLSLSGAPDVVALDAQGQVVLLDFKTPAQAGDPDFARQADQLTAYQVLLTQQAEELGIAGVAAVGFLELVKRKVPEPGSRGQGPVILGPHWSPAREPAALREYVQKVRWLAEDIRRERFPRRTRLAHNAPCSLCAFRTHCLTGTDEDLILPETVVDPAATAIPAASVL